MFVTIVVLLTEESVSLRQVQTYCNWGSTKVWEPFPNVVVIATRIPEYLVNNVINKFELDKLIKAYSVKSHLYPQ